MREFFCNSVFAHVFCCCCCFVLFCFVLFCFILFLFVCLFVFFCFVAFFFFLATKKNPKSQNWAQRVGLCESTYLCAQVHETNLSFFFLGLRPPILAIPVLGLRWRSEVLTLDILCNIKLYSIYSHLFNIWSDYKDWKMYYFQLLACISIMVLQYYVFLSSIYRISLLMTLWYNKSIILVINWYGKDKART